MLECYQRYHPRCYSMSALSRLIRFAEGGARCDAPGPLAHAHVGAGSVLGGGRRRTLELGSEVGGGTRRETCDIALKLRKGVTDAGVVPVREAA